MRTTIDAAGRLVIPKRLRDRLGFPGGQAVEIDEMGDHLEIRAVRSGVRVVDEADGPVLVTDDDAEPLTDEDVRSLIEESRR